MGRPKATFLRSHSHRAPHNTNPLLGRYLEEDVGRLEKQPIIPKQSKPMFAQRSGEEMRSKVPGPLELNQIFKEYSRLDPRLRRDVNFKGYLEILGLKGSSSHGPRNSSTSWDDKKDLHHKINKMQVQMFDGKKMTARAWLHQLQTYFTQSPNMVEEDAIHFASLHFEGDTLERWQHVVISQGYSLITSFDEFARRLVKRFDRKKENDYFQDLTSLRQHGERWMTMRQSFRELLS